MLICLEVLIIGCISSYGFVNGDIILHNYDEQGNLRRPTIVFILESEGAAMIKNKNKGSKLMEMINSLTPKYGRWRIFSDFVQLAGYAISNLVDNMHYDEREEAYLSIVKRYNAQEMTIFANMLGQLQMEIVQANKYQDILGHIYEELELYNESNGQFFTPELVCTMMAKMTAGNLKEQLSKKEYLTLGEPCSGSGRMIFAFAEEMRRQKLKPNKQLLVHAMDVDIVCAMMTYLQLSLYDIPAIVTHGNTITMKVNSEWYTPAFVVDEWYKKLDQIAESKLEEKTQIIELPGEVYQMELFA